MIDRYFDYWPEGQKLYKLSIYSSIIIVLGILSYTLIANINLLEMGLILLSPLIPFVLLFSIPLFLQVSPIGILKSQIDDQNDIFRFYNKHIGMVRGKMHKIREIIDKNKEEIEKSNKDLLEIQDANQVSMKTKKIKLRIKTNDKLGIRYKSFENLYQKLIQAYYVLENFNEYFKAYVDSIRQLSIDSNKGVENASHYKEIYEAVKILKIANNYFYEIQEVIRKKETHSIVIDEIEDLTNKLVEIESNLIE